MKPAVLLLGAGGAAAENVADALKRSGNHYDLVGADCDATKLHLSSAPRRFIVPRAGSDDYARSIHSLVRQCGIDVLHAQPDPEVVAIGAIRKDLRAHTYLPSQEVLVKGQDKATVAQLLTLAGVSVPESAEFTSTESLLAITADFLQRHERVWIRAKTGAGSKASLPVRKVAQAQSWVSWWIEERGLRSSDFMLSEFLPGREYAYQSVWSDGKLIAGQARERVEYLYGHLTPHGQTSTPAVARTVCNSRIDELAMNAVMALDAQPRGVFCVDIKESATGRPCVTEINAGRFFTTSNFFAAAGLNMPDMLMRLALGEHVPELGSSPLREGLYWIRMVDMGYTLVTREELDAWPRAHP